MDILIEKYIGSLKKEQINEFALKNDVQLDNNELDFVFGYVKENWRFLLSSKGELDFSRFKDSFRDDNFEKIEKLIILYKEKYQHLL